MASGSDTRTILGMARKTIRDKKGNVVAQGARKTALSGPGSKRSLESRSGALNRASRRLTRKGFRKGAEQMAVAAELERVDAKEKRGSSIRSAHAEMDKADNARTAGRVARGIASGVGVKGAFGVEQPVKETPVLEPQPKIVGPSSTTGATSPSFETAKDKLAGATSANPQGAPPSAGSTQSGPAAPAPTGVGPKPGSTTSSSTSPVTGTAPATPVTPVPPQPVSPAGPAAPAGQSPLSTPGSNIGTGHGDPDDPFSSREDRGRRQQFGLPAYLSTRMATERANVHERAKDLMSKYKKAGLTVSKEEAQSDAQQLLFKTHKREILDELRGVLNPRKVTAKDEAIANQFEKMASIAEMSNYRGSALDLLGMARAAVRSGDTETGRFFE